MLKQSRAFFNTCALSKNDDYNEAKSNASEPQRIQRQTRFNFVFVRCQEIPLVHQREKRVLFYSKEDYGAFVEHEKRQRKAILLTMRVIQGKGKEFFSGKQPLSLHHVATMYNYILSR
jgi:hypothetical protein